MRAPAAGLGVEVGQVGMRGGQLRHPLSMPRPRPAVEAYGTCGLPQTCHPECVPLEHRGGYSLAWT